MTKAPVFLEQTDSNPHKLALLWANLIHYSEFGHRAHFEYTEFVATFDGDPTRPADPTPTGEWYGYEDPTRAGVFKIVRRASEPVPF